MFKAFLLISAFFATLTSEATLATLIVALGVHAAKGLAEATKSMAGLTTTKPKNDHLAQTLRLVKAQTRLLDSLMRYQRKGRQSVTVEHLRVG